MSLCNYSASFSPYILRSLWLKENKQLLDAGFYKALEGTLNVVSASLSATASTHHHHHQ